MAKWVDKLMASRPAVPMLDVSLRETSDSTSDRADEWDLALVNYRAEPVFGAAVRLNASAVRAAAGLADGALEAVTTDGTVVPLLPSPDGQRLIAHVPSVPPNGALFLKFRVRPEGWPDLLREIAPEKAEEGITNGLIACATTDKGLRLLLGDPAYNAADVLKDLRLTGALDSGTGKLTPFTLPASCGSKVRVDRGDRFIRITCTQKDVGGTGADLSWSATLFRGLTMAEWSYAIENNGGKDLTIRECVLRASFGKLMSRLDKTVSQPLRRGKTVVEDQRQTLRLPVNFSRNAQITNHFTLGVRDKGGYGLGVVSLKPLDYRPLLRINALVFGVSQIPGTNGEPVRIARGEQFTGGMTFLPCTPGQNPYECASRVYRAHASERGIPAFADVAHSPLAVFLRRTPVVGASVQGVYESNRTINRLVALSGNVTRSNGMIRLTRIKDDGVLAWALKLPPDAERMLKIDTADVSAEAKLEVVVRDGAGNEAIRKPAGTSIRLPADGGTVSVELRLSGPAGASVDIESISIGKALLPAPELEFPMDGADVTDFAFKPEWKPVGDAAGYRLQVASDRSFTPGKLVIDLHRKTPGEPAGQPLLPRLQPGNYWWRVRAWQNGPVGAWSDVRQCHVNRDYSVRAVDFRIDADNPTFIFRGPAELKNAIPPNLRGFVMRRGAPSDKMTPDDLDVVAIGSSLSALEHWFQTHERVRGVMICERFWKVYHDSEAQREYFTERLRTFLLLCAKYGKIFFWSDGNGNKDHWGPLGADLEWVGLFRRYADHIIVGNKSNVWMAAHSTHSHTQGMWLTGLSSQLMSSLEWWYWRDVGFPEDLDTYAGRDQGVACYIPPAVYIEQFLVGMCQGASVYQIGTVHIVGEPETSPGTVLFSPDGTPTPAFTRHILPFIRFIAEQRPIPSRAQVLDNIHVAVAIDDELKPEPVRRDLQYGIYEALYRGTYGLDDTPWKHHLDKKKEHNGSNLWEYVPNTGRYGVFPLIPLCVDANSAKRAFHPGTVIVPLSKMQDPKKVKVLFDRYYPPVESEAFTACWGGTFVVINSHENKDVDEPFVLRFPDQPIRAIEGELGVQGSILGENRGGTMTVHLDSARPERSTTVSLQCKGTKPTVTVTPADSLHRENWDARDGKLQLEISHANGAANLEIRVNDK